MGRHHEEHQRDHHQQTSDMHLLTKTMANNMFFPPQGRLGTIWGDASRESDGLDLQLTTSRGNAPVQHAPPALAQDVQGIRHSSTTSFWARECRNWAA